MLVTIPIVIVLLAIVGVLCWKGGLKWWHAAVVVLLGFAIASWPAVAPVVGSILAGLVHEINRR
ncbi:hypothetical protein [Fodinicola feengrottensis]|uniref:Uncharacterized protein n=1 Tax=Fodinicola feengrottensis TaxID=435914 RepID=A0ABN2IDI3_9ACTN|nr:hypothetical protein [Fodinicola feengrottensis]